VEKEVWQMGVNYLLLPLTTFTLKTVVANAARSFLNSFWIKFLICCGIVVVLLMQRLGHGGTSQACAASGLSLVYMYVCGALSVLQAVWPPLLDAVCLFYILSELVGSEKLSQDVPVFAMAGAGCLVAAWVIQRWWIWIIGLQVLMCSVALLSCIFRL